MAVNIASSACRIKRAIAAGAVALSMSTAMVASTAPAEAHMRHGYHHHRHFGYHGRTGFHSCMNRSYGTRAIHFRRGC